MKIGFILESGPDGAEQKILERLIPKVDSSVEIRRPFVHNDGKPEMIANCGEDAALLLSECDRVVILCDLGSERHKCGWKEALERDIAVIRVELGRHDADNEKVRLLIIQEEIETWLVADHKAVAAFLSASSPRSCTLKKVKNPQIILNPKKQLNKMFEGWRPRYWDIEHADGIAKHIEIENIQSVCSFARFKRLLTETEFACQRFVGE